MPSGPYWLVPPNSDVIKYAPEWACAIVFRQLIHLPADDSESTYELMGATSLSLYFFVFAGWYLLFSSIIDANKCGYNKSLSFSFCRWASSSNSSTWNSKDTRFFLRTQFIRTWAWFFSRNFRTIYEQAQARIWEKN